MIDRNILLNALQSANKALKGANAELNLEAKDGQILISGVSPEHQHLEPGGRRNG